VANILYSKDSIARDARDISKINTRSVAEVMKYKDNIMEEGIIPGRPAVSRRELFTENSTIYIQTPHTGGKRKKKRIL